MRRTMILAVGLLTLALPGCKSSDAPQAHDAHRSQSLGTQMAQSLGTQITSQGNIQEITESYSETQNRLTKNKQAKASRRKECQVGNRDNAPCVTTSYGGIEFLPPYPFALNPDGQEINIGMETRNSWAPENSVYGSSSVLEPFLGSATSNKPVSCDASGNCRMAVSVTAPNGRTLAICDALMVGTVLGPPTHCESVAIRDGSKWWIKVIEGNEVVCPSMAPIYHYEIEGIPRSSILTTIDQALSTAPLLMPDRTMKSDRLMALAPKRFSTILSGGWFEWPQILVEVDGQFRIDVSLDLLVNKQNTAEPADWHLPTDQQQDEYRVAITRRITAALNSVCIEPMWEGSRVLSCSKLRTSDGAVVQRPDPYGGKPLDPRVTLTRPQY